MNPKSFRLSQETRHRLTELAEWYGESEADIVRQSINSTWEAKMSKEYNYEIIFIETKGGKKGQTIKRQRKARNEFEATQKAGAFNKVVISVINLDL